jgi:hypothetical protein
MGLGYLDMHEHGIARAAPSLKQAVRGPAVSEDEGMPEPALHGAGVCISRTRHGAATVRMSDSQSQADDTAVCSWTHQRAIRCSHVSETSCHAEAEAHPG